MASEEKRQLRQSIREIRAGLPLSFRDGASQEICRRLVGHFQAETGTSIGLYAGFGEEVCLKRAFEDLASAGKTVGFPQVMRLPEGGISMVFREIHDWKQLRSGFRGILEPGFDAPILEPHVIVVPGLGFTRHGARLGYGAGTYDRYLSTLDSQPLTVGVAFSQCIVPNLPEEPHDRRVNWVITEQEVIPCGNGEPCP